MFSCEYCKIFKRNIFWRLSANGYFWSFLSTLFEYNAFRIELLGRKFIIKTWNVVVISRIPVVCCWTELRPCSEEVKLICKPPIICVCVGLLLSHRCGIISCDHVASLWRPKSRKSKFLALFQELSSCKINFHFKTPFYFVKVM